MKCGRETEKSIRKQRVSCQMGRIYLFISLLFLHCLLFSERQRPADMRATMKRNFKKAQSTAQKGKGTARELNDVKSKRLTHVVSFEPVHAAGRRHDHKPGEYYHGALQTRRFAACSASRRHVDTRAPAHRPRGLLCRLLSVGSSIDEALFVQPCCLTL